MSREKLLAKTPAVRITTKGGIELFVRKLSAHESAEYTFMGCKTGGSSGQLDMDIAALKRRQTWLLSKVISDEKGKRYMAEVDFAEVESDLFGEILELVEPILGLNVPKAVEEEKKD